MLVYTSHAKEREARDHRQRGENYKQGRLLRLCLQHDAGNDVSSDVRARKEGPKVRIEKALICFTGAFTDELTLSDPEHGSAGTEYGASD